MTTVTVIKPDQTQLTLGISDDVLVFDGQTYVKPEDAKFVMLFDVTGVDIEIPNEGGAPSLAMRDLANSLCKVVAWSSLPLPQSPGIVIASNPSPICICLMNCNGVFLKSVTVIEEPA